MAKNKKIGEEGSAKFKNLEDKKNSFGKKRSFFDFLKF